MTIEVDTLIVGAGPVGLTGALLLAGQGQRCLIVERRDGPQRHPAAHVINARTLEIWRQAGLDMSAILAMAADPADAGHVNFVTRLDGALIGRLQFERQGPEVEALTPTPLRNISQHRLEPLLAQTAAASPEVDLRYRAEWQSSTQDADGVSSIIRDLATGEAVEVRSRWVLGADGAASGVRKALGIDMVGPAVLQSFIAIHFKAELRSVIADRPGVLHFVMDPEASGTFIAHDIDREWVFMTRFDPATESPEDFDHERCESIVRAALGDVSVPVDIVSAGSWHMSAQVADRMRDGRIFLVGDAAHRFPPTGGLGLNTGVADVHNLVWKLAAVAAGWAGPTLLDTYESERLPIAHANCEQSTENAFKMVTLIEALGIMNDPTTEGVLATLADPANQAAIAAAVEDQATHFDMIGLQLGYAYGAGAVVRDGEVPGPVVDPRRFEPVGAVGARLPHAWLGDGQSTLDLVETGRLTLLSMGDHDVWVQAVASASAPVCHVRLGVDPPPLAEWVRQCRLASDAALLVRPDQHIAWRSDEVTAPGPPRLATALRTILAMDP